VGKNHKIKYVYGTPECKWSGGRISYIKINNIKIIEKILYNILSYNMTPSFTFTNTAITKNDIKDSFCNDLLKIIDDTNSEIILCSDILFDYIKEKYPKIKICASVLKSTYQNIKDIDETDFINKLTDKYDRVVIRPEYAIINNGDLSKIKDISKIDLLINQNCAMNCDVANIEYRLIELFNRKKIKSDALNKFCMTSCPRDTGKTKELNTLSNELIYKCINNGITKLKLNGRHLDYESLLNTLLIYYFNEDINKDEIRKEANDFILSSVKNSPDLQSYYLMCNIK